jgi:hypothetical protein
MFLQLHLPLSARVQHAPVLTNKKSTRGKALQD